MNAPTAAGPQQASTTTTYEMTSGRAGAFKPLHSAPTTGIQAAKGFTLHRSRFLGRLWRDTDWVGLPLRSNRTRCAE